MHPEFWQKIKEEIAVLRVGILPGMTVIILVIIARLMGSMQSLEWLAFDTFLRLRPTEPIDERILIVGINEEDIRSIQKYPIPDKEIATLLLKLKKYNPRVIGLDIYRDLPIEPGHSQLVNAFQNIKNVIAIEKVLPEEIFPPSTLPPQQIGFADQITDLDGKLRRSLLGISTDDGYKYSLSFRLAQAYLAHEGITLENGIRNRNVIAFGNTKLPRFLPNSGGYVDSDAAGVQVLLNFRNRRKAFRTICFSDIKKGNFQPEWIRDRIVIIGLTAPSQKDFITTVAIKSSKPATRQVYGVEIKAHNISQILSAVLNSRPLLKTWADIWEYVWILGCGILGIVFARLTAHPLRNLIAVGIANINLILLSYLLLLWGGWWIPVAPAMLVLMINGIGITALYEYEHAVKLTSEARQRIIERTFETIHNGPLQTLSKALKQIQTPDISADKLIPKIAKDLEKLNSELRDIYDFLHQESLNQDTSLYLGNGLVLNLLDPINELLYQVYSNTLERDFPYFDGITIQIRSFEPIDETCLNIDKKQGICRFLEEALCNVGKHAEGVTRLEVTCTQNQDRCILRVVDNGIGLNSSREGRGTQQSKNLARKLRGKFTRVSLSPRGTLCELSWSVKKFGW
ncbi:MAG: CHASE2 domain-containing protein [Nostocaceae cyanobacterium]|nr:CHASE2 domain-containing protein [Nostocaceae cyanobacterium]